MEDSTALAKKSKNAKKRARMKARKTQTKQSEANTIEEQENNACVAESVDADDVEQVDEEKLENEHNSALHCVSEETPMIGGMKEEIDAASEVALEVASSKKLSESTPIADDADDNTDTQSNIVAIKNLELQPSGTFSASPEDAATTTRNDVVEEEEDDGGPSMSDLLRSISESLPKFASSVPEKSEKREVAASRCCDSASEVSTICAAARETKPLGSKATSASVSPLSQHSLVHISSSCEPRAAMSSASVVIESDVPRSKYAFEEGEQLFFAREKEMEQIAKESNYAAMAAISSLSLMEIQAACSLVSQPTSTPTPRGQTKVKGVSLTSVPSPKTSNRTSNGSTRPAVPPTSTSCRNNLTPGDAKWLESLAKAAMEKRHRGTDQTRQHQEQITTVRNNVGDNDEDEEEEEDMYLTQPTSAVTTGALDADDVKSPAEVRRSLLCLADEDEPQNTDNTKKRTLGFFEAIFSCASVAEK